MNERPQDRTGRRPLAALLILIGLLFGPASLAAGAPSSGPALGRSAPARQGALLPTLRASEREGLPGEAADGSGFLPPAAPAIVSAPLPARPAAEPAGASGLAPGEGGAASYRARAPPAR